MVREQIWRRKKYEAKLDGTVAERRIEDYGKYMKDLHRSITSTLVVNEELAKTTILEPAGVATSIMPFYLNAMREFCRVCRTFTCQPIPDGPHITNCPSRDNECYNVWCRYKDKGLNSTLLIKLAGMCGCYPLGYGYYVEYDPNKK